MKNVLIGSALFIFLAFFESNVYGQTLEISYPSAIATLPGKGEKVKKEGEVKFVWETNFRVREVRFIATLVRSGFTSTQQRSFGITAEEKTINRKLEDDNVDQFDTTLDYGEAPLDEKTTSLTINIVAIDKESNTEVKRTAKIGLDNIKKIYELSKPIPVGEAPIITWQPEPKPATTNSITVQASATQTFLAEAFAYQTDNESFILNLEAKKSQRKAFVEGEKTEFEFKDLEDGRPYFIVIREVNPPTTRKSGTSTPLAKRTLSITSRPNISWIDNTPQNIKNSELFVSLRISKSSEIVVKLFEYDTSISDFVERSSNKIQTSEYVSANDREFKQKINLAFLPEKRYKVKVFAYSSIEGLQPDETNFSEEFTGVKVKLFDDVQLDLSQTAIKLTPTGVFDRVKLTATARVGNFSVNFTCPTAGSITSSCNLDTASGNFLQQIQANQTAGDQAGNGQDLLNTNIQTGEVRSFMRITLTATSDDTTERTQTQSFELAFTARKSETAFKNLPSLLMEC